MERALGGARDSRALFGDPPNRRRESSFSEKARQPSEHRVERAAGPLAEAARLGLSAAQAAASLERQLQPP